MRRQISVSYSHPSQGVAVNAGQTHDYKDCVRRGVNGVRVGEGIFGKRQCGFFDWRMGENREREVESKGARGGASVRGSVVSENVRLPTVEYEGFGAEIGGGGGMIPY